MKVSIITVNFNNAVGLERTIESVVRQPKELYEYIIIDGGSTDGSVEIIKKYEQYVTYWTSEKDNGIYDAMNKAIDLLKGNWVNFMNAGDKFYNDNVLSNIAKEIELNYGVIFGDKIGYEDGEFDDTRTIAECMFNDWCMVYLITE